jgi:hypothetical protein
MSDMKKNNNKMGDDQVADIAKVALGVMAVGLSAGLALIAGAKKAGDKYAARKKREAGRKRDFSDEAKAAVKEDEFREGDGE